MTISEEDEPETTAEPEGRDRSGFVWGLVCGVVVGSAAALLLAPRTGRDTRRRIQRRLVSARSQLGERLEDLEGAVRHELRRRRRRHR